MKKTGVNLSMIILLFAINYVIIWFIPQKPIWLDVAIHGLGGCFSALYIGSLMDWRARGFREGGSFFRFVVIACGAVTLGVAVELFESLDSFYSWSVLVEASEPSYWNNIRDLWANSVGAVWGTLIYLAWNDINQ